MKLASSFLTLALITSASSAYALGEHQWDWGSRARYGNIAADNAGQSASLLVRNTLESQWSSSLGSTLELDAVGSAFDSDHSDGVRFNGQPQIPDPAGLDLNQALLSLDLARVKFRLGRQRINLDQQRFVGGNGFWQNEQTFDALFSEWQLASNSRFSYGYIANVNRIFGADADRENLGRKPTAAMPSVPPRPLANYGDHKHHTHISQLEWNEWDYTRITAYAHRMDNLTMPAASNSTQGASYSLHYKLGRVKYRLQLEAAQQNRFDLGRAHLPYRLFDAGVGFGTLEVNARYERLGQSKGVAFITPLGSNHKFEGWAGVVGNTPNSGLRDSSFGLLWRSSPWRLESAYHLFKDDLRGAAIGREWDLDIAFKPARKHSLSLRLAQFEPELGSSVRKLFLDYAFNL